MISQHYFRPYNLVILQALLQILTDWEINNSEWWSSTSEEDKNAPNFSGHENWETFL